jgi:RNA polymerase sigma-70 factor (ECF subfamily)
VAEAGEEIGRTVVTRSVQLALRARLGHVLRALGPRLTSVALRYAPDRDAAEDIVENACEKALRHLDGFRGEARRSTWVHRIVVNESLMWLRSERRRARRLAEVDEDSGAEWTEPSPGPAQRVNARQQRELLWRALAALPADERDVLVRCALEDTSYERFSTERGIGPAAAKSRAFRGRRRLRDLLIESDIRGLGDF